MGDKKVIGIALDVDWMRFDEICGPASLRFMARGDLPRWREIVKIRSPSTDKLD